jgi:ubiquinone/menaquinone biosynthesis C-methylase UbiE
MNPIDQRELLSSAALADVERIKAEYVRRDRELAGRYSWAQPVNRFLHCRTVCAAIAALTREGLFPFNGRSVLEVGCGTGNWLLECAQWGAELENISGIDLDAERVEQARRRLPGADIRCGNAAELPWETGSFDVVLQFTVFTSVLDRGLKERMAAEMVRVMKPQGAVLWYDFRYNNPRNPHVRGIEKREIRKLFPGHQITFHKTTLAPPLARAAVGLSWMAALALEAVPPLRTHYVGVIRRRT